MSDEIVMASRYAYRGRIVDVRLDDVRLTNGVEALREVVEHRPAVCIVAIDADDRVLFVRQFRLPVGRFLLEVPAGSTEAGEDPSDAARRELAEETGFRPGKLQRLGGFYSAPGFCTEYLHTFLATDLTPESRPGDADEQIELVRIPRAEAIEMARNGDFEDAKTLACLAFLAAR